MKTRCQYCQQLNKRKRENCRFCGAPLSDEHKFDRVNTYRQGPMPSGSVSGMLILDESMVSGSVDGLRSLWDKSVLDAMHETMVLRNWR